MENTILKTLERIENLLLSNKNTLNIEELSTYTGWSKSSIYKKNMHKQIPYYKEDCDSRSIYYKRSEIDTYLTRYRISTHEEIAIEANNLLIEKKARK